jgi:aminomethyltransferase
MADSSKTPLYDRHVNTAAKMVDFHGWEMPLWYPTGAVAEHRAVVTNAGLFDTSHMSLLSISGPNAFDLLQLCFTRDLSACVTTANRPLAPGECVYGAFLNEQGHLIDDGILYQVAPANYLCAVNAGMGSVVAGHLVTHMGGRDAQVTDLFGTVGKIDLQGPLSAGILMRVLKDPEVALADMRYFTFKGRFDPCSPGPDVCLLDGAPILLSRTGYTGEFGFEIFVRAEHLVNVWDSLLSAGQDVGLLPCGLAARDSLRAGAVLPLAQQDIGPWPYINHPWERALPFAAGGTSFTKKFIGDVVLRSARTAPFTVAFVGRDPRKVSVEDPAVLLGADGSEIGSVLTCVADMAIGRRRGRVFSIASPDKPDDFKAGGLCCGFVRSRLKLIGGQAVALKDKRREIEVTIARDIRPDRTARRPMTEMMSWRKSDEGNK